MIAPDFRLDGKVAVVTGAGGGIGGAIARGIAASGSAVGLLDLSGSDLEGTAASIQQDGGSSFIVPVDVTDPEDLKQAISSVESELGPLNAAVNAAGIVTAAHAEEMPAEQWKKVMEVNVDGVFYSCQAEGNAMIRNGGGSIVNIASMSATIANRDLYQAHYNSSKAAVKHLGRSLGWEWATKGVRVNSISPGYTETPMTQRPEQREAMAGYARDTPMGRNAKPEEMVGPAVFLLSDAASFVTGIDLLVDGGWTIW